MDHLHSLTFHAISLSRGQRLTIAPTVCTADAAVMHKWGVADSQHVQEVPKGETRITCTA